MPGDHVDAFFRASAHRAARLQDASRWTAAACDTAANDVWHWQTTLVTKDITAVTGRLRTAGVRFVTPDVLVIPEQAQAQLGFKKAVMVRDPSSHAIRLVEE